MKSEEREILLFIAREEPLKDTLRRFPRTSRKTLQQMIERLCGVGEQAAPAPGNSARLAPGGELVLFTDGASRGNPGLAGAGALLALPNGTVVAEQAVFLGTCTNNEAEYKALIIGLELAKKFQPAKLEIRMDSELVVRQLNGQYRVRHEGLVPLFRKAQDLLREFPGVNIQHIRRELNARADALSNQAIDERDR
jgi:ribonuclease HI